MFDCSTLEDYVISRSSRSVLKGFFFFFWFENSKINGVLLRAAVRCHYKICIAHTVVSAVLTKLWELSAK